MKKELIIFIIIAIFTFGCLFIYEHILQIKKNDIDLADKTQEIVEEEQEEIIITKEDTRIKMSVIGDIMCHNSQYKDAYNSSTGIYDFSYVFEDIKHYISSADVAIGNLETTFAGPKRGYSNFPRFNTPEHLAQNLKDFGIDVLSTANNHSMDTNYNGVVSTLDYLDEAGVSHTGTYRTAKEQNTILVKEINGIKIAFLAFTYGTNGIPVPADKSFCVNLIDEQLILKQIELAKKEEPDLICANMHWGIEYQTKQNAEQEKLANLLFKNGVDIILGSHPHVLQPMEKKKITLDNGIEKECFVIYSLGNFMSGQVAENTRNSIILNIDIVKSGETGNITIEKIDYIPIYTYRAPKGSTKRYKVLDIRKAISNYESGIDNSIGKATYTTLKKELNKIERTLGNI